MHHQCTVSNSTYCEMLLGFVVLIEVDAGSAVLLHGITGQQLSGGQKTHTSRNGSKSKKNLAFPQLKLKLKYLPMKLKCIVINTLHYKAQS